MTQLLVDRIPFDVWVIILERALDLDDILGPACTISHLVHFHLRHPVRDTNYYPHKWLSLALVCKVWLSCLHPYAHLVVQIHFLELSPCTGRREPVLGRSKTFLSQRTHINTKIMYYEPKWALLRYGDLSKCLTWTPNLQTLVLIGASECIPICSMLRLCTPLLSLRRLEIAKAELIPYSYKHPLFETINRLFPNLRRLGIKSCTLHPSATHGLRLAKLESLTLLDTGTFDHQILTWDLPSLRCLEFGSAIGYCYTVMPVIHELSVLRNVIQHLGTRLHHLALPLMYPEHDTLLCEEDWIRDLPELRSLFIEFIDFDSAIPLSAIPAAHPLSHIWVRVIELDIGIPKLLRIPSNIHRTICVPQTDDTEDRIILKNIEEEVLRMNLPNVTVEGIYMNEEFIP